MVAGSFLFFVSREVLNALLPMIFCGILLELLGLKNKVLEVHLEAVLELI